jgi:uncharacterized protein (DUF433 family)
MPPEPSIRPPDTSNGRGLKLRQVNRTVAGRGHSSLTGIPSQTVIVGNGNVFVVSGDPRQAEYSFLAFDMPAEEIAIQWSHVAGQIVMRNALRSLASTLAKTYKYISTDRRVRKGMPHIRNTRIAVAHILSHLHALGTIEATVEAYSPQLTREQVKEAIAYAKDFLEKACAPTSSVIGG